MKRLPIVVTYCVVASAWAEGPSVKVGDISADQDTSILIRKGGDKKSALDFKDYEIVTGSDEIFGDPEPGKKAGYESWKAACAAWKKELKENNKDNQVLVSSCSSPKFAQEDGRYTYTSNGTYKLRVKVRAGDTPAR
jgi:hypothetical protein